MEQVHLSPSPHESFMQQGVAHANGLEFQFEVGGKADAPPILLIMGFGGQMLHWPGYFCKALIDKGFRVYRFDNRDIGLSSKVNVRIPRIKLSKLLIGSTLGLKNPDVSYHLTDMAEDTKQIMDALGLSSAHVLGMSMGGMIGQVLAAKYPEKVRSLNILFSSNNRALSQPPYPSAFKAILSKPKSRKEEDIARLGANLMKVIGSPEHVNYEAELERARFMYRRSYRPDGMVRQLHAIMGTGSLVKFNKKTKASTLVVHGSADRLLPPSNGKQIAKAIKGAKFQIVPGLGHDIPLYFTPKLVALFTGHINNVEA